MRLSYVRFLLCINISVPPSLVAIWLRPTEGRSAMMSPLMQNLSLNQPVSLSSPAASLYLPEGGESAEKANAAIHPSSDRHRAMRDRRAIRDGESTAPSFLPCFPFSLFLSLLMANWQYVLRRCAVASRHNRNRAQILLPYF